MRRFWQFVHDQLERAWHWVYYHKLHNPKYLTEVVPKNVTYVFGQNAVFSANLPATNNTENVQGETQLVHRCPLPEPKEKSMTVDELLAKLDAEYDQIESGIDALYLDVRRKDGGRTFNGIMQDCYTYPRYLQDTPLTEAVRKIDDARRRQIEIRRRQAELKKELNA